MKLLDTLKSENEKIAQLVTYVTDHLNDVQYHGEFNKGFIDQTLEYLTGFALAVHNEKVDGVFIPLLKKKPLSSSETEMLAELEQDHEYEEKAIGELELSSKKNEEQDDDIAFAGSIVVHLRFLVDFYAQHVEKESTGLFPLAEKYLNENDWEYLSAEFTKIDQKAVHDTYQNLLEEIAENQNFS